MQEVKREGKRVTFKVNIDKETCLNRLKTKYPAESQVKLNKGVPRPEFSIWCGIESANMYHKERSIRFLKVHLPLELRFEEVDCGTNITTTFGFPRFMYTYIIACLIMLVVFLVWGVDKAFPIGDPLEKFRSYFTALGFMAIFYILCIFISSNNSKRSDAALMNEEVLSLFDENII